jgi:quercetin 2,3-dioxygenase
MRNRTVKRLHPANSDDIGDLRTQRPLPNARLQHLDPFLFLNHHGPQVYPPDNRGLPFGPHPHRGFETVTFIVEGSLAHRDTGGHESVIHAGGVQWMTAGRGLEHSELSPEEFMKEGGPLEILQLWVNLPARLKMTDPRYAGFQKEAIPSIRTGGATIQLISGEWEGQCGAVESLTEIVMTTVALEAGGRVTLPAPAERTVFLYIVRGEVLVSGTAAPEMHLVEVEADGDAIELEATSNALVLFGHGAPYHEPVVAHGPFVMNTAEEIMQAVRDYHAGLFA